MPTRLEAWDWRPVRRASIYAWDAYLDGGVWLLQNGEDFKVSVKTMQMYIGKAAKARGLKARMEVQNDGSIVIQAGPRMPGKPRGAKHRGGGGRGLQTSEAPELKPLSEEWGGPRRPELELPPEGDLGGPK